MRNTAAKGRKLLSSLAAVCVLAALGAAPPAEASRYLPSLTPDVAAAPPVLESAPQPARSLGLFTDDDVLVLTACSELDEKEVDQLLEQRRFWLLTEPRSRKLASGVLDKPGERIYLEANALGWKSHQGVCFAQPDPLGPVDSPNLYQAFGFDAFNVTDPWGMTKYGHLTAEVGPADLIPSQYAESGNEALDRTAVCLYNDVRNFGAGLINLCSNAFWAMGVADQWTKDQVVEYTPLEDVDIAFLETYFATNPEAASAAATSLRYGTARALARFRRWARENNVGGSIEELREFWRGLPIHDERGAIDLDLPEGPLRRHGQQPSPRPQGQQSHHVVQDARVKELEGYSRGRAPTDLMPGPATRVGTQHGEATAMQARINRILRSRGSTSMTYRQARSAIRAEYKAAGKTEEEIREAIEAADAYFIDELGITLDTPLRVPSR